MIKQNLHTHSLYDDGRDTIADMVSAAKDKGFTILGFSGHAYNPVDAGSMTPEKTKLYKAQVQAFKDNPPEGMEIFLGIEEDSLTPVNPEEYDYVIGSVHYLQKDGNLYAIDYSKEEFERMLQEGWNNDIYALSQAYYKAIAQQAKNSRIDIIGHLDLITKYNEEETYFAFDDPILIDQAKQAIKKLVGAGKLFEMNTGAIGRGYRKTPYPSIPLLKAIQEAGGGLLINTDCHNREYLDIGMSECLRLAKEAGFTHLYALTKQGFVKTPIKDFEF